MAREQSLRKANAMGDIRVDREAFRQWSRQQLLLLERTRTGNVWLFPRDGVPTLSKFAAAVDAMDRGESIELTDKEGRVVSVMELTADGYTEYEVTDEQHIGRYGESSKQV